MRKVIQTTAQGTGTRANACKRCAGTGKVTANGKATACITCSGRGSGYATKTGGKSNGLGRSS